MAKIELVRAPNPGPLTGPGTNSYVVESAGEAIILDPGPVIAEHLEAIRTALDGLNPAAVVVTHAHPDHSSAANGLGLEFDVPVLGFGDGPGFVPTDRLADEALVEFGKAALLAVHTPGHTADHLCFLLGDLLFTGDHIVGGTTVIVEDAIAYMRSLNKVARLEPAHLYPGHGPVMSEAQGVIEEYIAHRVERERQVVAAVRGGAVTVDDIVDVVYAGIDPALRTAAIYQVHSQLQKLNAEGRVVFGEGGVAGTTVVRLVEET